MKRKWLRELREQYKLSQQTLADLIGKNVTSIGKYELGERRPSPEVAKKIAVALNFEKHGLDWTKFFEEDKPKPA